MAGANFHSFTVRRALSSSEASSPLETEAAPTDPSRRTSTMSTTVPSIPLARALSV